MKRRIVHCILPFILFLPLTNIFAKSPSSTSGFFIKLAEEFFQFKLYTDSISFYQNALETKDETLDFETLHLKMALALFLNGEYEKSLHSLKGLKNCDLKMLLTSFCLRKTRSHELAEKTLLECIKEKEEKGSLLLLQLAAILLEQENAADAEYYLNQMGPDLKESHLSLKNMLEILISLKKGDHQLVKKWIKQEKELHGSCFETDWLEAVEAFLSKKYLKSSILFLKRIEKEPNLTKRPQLISSFITSLKTSLQKKPEDSAKILEILEAGIKKMTEQESSQEVLLGLIKLQLLKQRLLKEEQPEKWLFLFNKLLLNSQPTMVGLKLDAYTSRTEKEDILKKWLPETKDLGIKFFFKGLHHYYETQKETIAEALTYHQQQALKHFKAGLPYLEETQDLLGDQYLKYYLQASLDFGDESHLLDCRQQIKGMQEKQNLTYQLGLLSAKLYSLTNKAPYLEEALRYTHQKPVTAEKQLLIGNIYYHNNEFEKALKALDEVANKWKNSIQAPDALYMTAKIWEETKESQEKICSIFQSLYKNYPDSSYAPEAYFRSYPFYEYLQGSKQAIKHLDQFEKRYPNSPYLLNALFLKGLNYKKDRKDSSDKWLIKRNMTKAKRFFQAIENKYVHLFSVNLPKDQKQYYKALYQRAILEKSLIDLEIAKESAETKKQIYLEYAKEHLQHLLQDLDSESIKNTLKTEALLTLASVYEETQENARSSEMLLMLIEEFKKENMTKGYFISKAWIQLANSSLKQERYEESLSLFLKADLASDGQILNDDQKLTIWIDISECYRKLNQYDLAMTYLSKTINANAISGLRIKAMYLRAKIYHLQDRHELAKKQLEAASLKGGKWGKQAKEKLVKLYGNN